MSNILADYEKKQAELKALGEKLETDLTAEFVQYMKNGLANYEHIKAINPKFNLFKASPEFNMLCKAAMGFGTRKPKTTGGNETGNGKAAPTPKGAGKRTKGSNEPTPKENEILAFIGDGNKSNAEINKHFKMANSSVNTTKMKDKGLIKKTDGKWHKK